MQIKITEVHEHVRVFSENVREGIEVTFKPLKVTRSYL